VTTFTLGEGGNHRLNKYSGQQVEIIEARPEGTRILVQAEDGHTFSVFPEELT
jgi:hypothetical protein